MTEASGGPGAWLADKIDTINRQHRQEEEAEVDKGMGCWQAGGQGEGVCRGVGGC